ncbi:Gfo/Idh/MocA family oxidoreductase [Patescibacteria group bacterium]|nr:Gfo/Idh/MocA family oxidoreductase [Patescibacteria group bacterium]
MNKKIAIIGSGFGMYGLLPAFATTEGCKVVSICADKSERLLSFCKRFGVDKIYSDWKEMLQKEKPDALCIAVIPRHQYEIAKYALENGISVFAEKPLTTLLDTSLELCELAKKNNLANMVDFIFPEIPEWVAAKAAIKSEDIGRIRNINVEWKMLSYDLKNAVKSWKTDINEGGGALSFFFSHVLYYLENFIGRIKSLECVLSSSEKSLNHGDSIINMVILFENGCTGNAHMDISFIGSQRHSIEFHGEKGTMVLQNNSESPVDNFKLTIHAESGTKELLPNKPSGLPYNDLDPRVKAIKPIAERFIKWCNTGVASKPDFQDGARVQELIELARASDARFHKIQS